MKGGVYRMLTNEPARNFQIGLFAIQFSPSSKAAFAESFRGNFPCGFAVENFHEKECGGNPDSI